MGAHPAASPTTAVNIELTQTETTRTDKKPALAQLQRKFLDNEYHYALYNNFHLQVTCKSMTIL